MKIAKKIYQENKDILEGCPNVDAYGEDMFGIGVESAYFMILNPDSPNYDDTLTSLETASNMMYSCCYMDTKAGFITPRGEAARIGMFESEITEDQIRNVLAPILFDLYKIK